MPGNRKDPQGYVILLHAASVFLETSEVGNVALCPKTLAEPFHLWFTSDFHGCPCWVGKQIVLLLDNI